MRNVRENADRSHRPGGPQARQYSVPKGRAASSGTELFTGVWGETVSKHYAEGNFYGKIEQKEKKELKRDGIYFRD